MNCHNHAKPWAALLALLLCLPVWLGLAALPAAAEQPGGPRVLFISSYSYAWPTVPQQLAGIQSALSEDVSLTVRCMNTKEINDAESLELFYKSMAYLLAHSRPFDAVITGDDDALNFVMRYREELFAGIPVVFEGVNDLRTALDAGSDPLITGVVEQISYADNLDLALRITPDAARVVALLDDTMTGRGERVQFYAQAKAYPELEFSEINASRLTADELEQAIAALEPDTIFLYLAASTDNKGNPYTNAQICRMIAENAAVPCYRFVSAGIGQGVLGGNIVSLEESGAIAAEMVMRILAGEPVSEIPVVTESPNSYVFDYAVMQKFGISRSQIPAGAEVLNYVPTFAEKHGRVVTVTIVVTLAVCALLIAFLRVLSIRRTNEVLTRKNEELAEAIADAERANQAKGRFLSDISHELRTPLSAIVSITTLARQYLYEPQRVEDYLDKIDGASHVLLGIINDVLDMSAIENEKVKLVREPFSLDTLLGNLHALYFSQCQARGIQFEVSSNGVTERELVGDALRVSQILMNLVSNACKFTPAGGSVWVTAEQTVCRGGQVQLRFTVADTGCGISQEMQQRMFRPFEQESAEVTHRYGGSGLGLAISKNLVDLMQGSIRCISEKGQGATFIVELPFACAAPAEAGPFRLLRALVVDNDLRTRTQTDSLLTHLGVAYDEADEKQALGMLTAARAEGRPYDVCFVSWKASGLDGLEVTRSIRRLYDQQQLQIVALAAEVEAVRAQAGAAGADWFLAQPPEQAAAVQVLLQIAEQVRERKNAVKDACDFSGRRVLIAEDQDLSAEIALELLHMLHLEVDRAENGEQAVELFAASVPGTYDAILMDVQMPLMDGYEAARAIRISGHPQAKTIPILAVTANAFAQDLAAALASGMNDSITKPIDQNMLRQMLARYIPND